MIDSQKIKQDTVRTVHQLPQTTDKDNQNRINKDYNNYNT